MENVLTEEETPRLRIYSRLLGFRPFVQLGVLATYAESGRRFRGLMEGYGGQGALESPELDTKVTQVRFLQREG